MSVLDRRRRRNLLPTNFPHAHSQFFTITFVPTFTRSYRSTTSLLVMRMQPDDTAAPIVSGSFEPWMR